MFNVPRVYATVRHCKPLYATVHHCTPRYATLHHGRRQYKLVDIDARNMHQYQYLNHLPEIKCQATAAADVPGIIVYMFVYINSRMLDIIYRMGVIYNFKKIREKSIKKSLFLQEDVNKK